MDHKRQWLMNKQTFQKFKNYRLKLYTHSKAQNDRYLTNYLINAVVHFLRSRKDRTMFMIEKLVHTSTSLVKRYYLVNEHQQLQISGQNLVCAMYLGLKLNQFNDNDIMRYALAWKKKKTPHVLFQSKLHYGDEGYSEQELIFLSNIGFQIGRSPLIQPFQSLCEQIFEHLGKFDKKEKQQMLKQTFYLLDKLYYNDEIMFLYPGPKLAICLAILWAERFKAERGQMQDVVDTYFSPEVAELIRSNQAQIYALKQIIDNIQHFIVNDHKAVTNEFSRLLTKKRRKSFENPGKKSPRLSPKSYTDFKERQF